MDADEEMAALSAAKEQQHHAPPQRPGLVHSGRPLPTTSTGDATKGNSNSSSNSSPTVLVAYEILESGHLHEVPLSEALFHNATYNPDAATATATAPNSILKEGAPDTITSSTTSITTTTTTIINNANNNNKSVPVSGTKPKSYWIDVLIESENTAALPQLQSEIFNHLTLPPLLARHLLDGEQLQTPQVLTLIHHAFIVMRILSLDDSFHEIRHTAALCLLHTIVTITTTQHIHRHQNASESQYATARRLLGHQSSMVDILKRELPEGTVSGATAVWLASHLGRTSAATRQLRLDVIDKCDDPIETISIHAVQNLKDTLLRLAAVAEEQRECLQGVVEGDLLTEAINFDEPLIKGLLRVNLSTAASTERMLFRMEKRVADLRSEYESYQQDRINKRLNVLTILSAIFLPLTLMAGVWGMNFTNMPELQREYAYYYAVGSMLVVGFGMLFTFYRYGWLS